MRKIVILLVILVVLVSGWILYSAIKKDANEKVTSQIHFINPKKEFSRTEIPEFTLAFPSTSSATIGKKTKDSWIEKGEKILISLVNKYSGNRIPAYIQKQSNGRFKVIVADSKDTKYGLYTIQVDATTDFKFERNLSQDFAWGVLAVNTNKSMYLPNEKAKLGFGVLDERGNTLCNANLTVEISNPDKKIQKFDTSTGGITKSPKCIGNTYSLDDDYFSFYNTGKEGRYYINLTAHTKNGKFTISDYFEVKNSLPYEVERTQFPTRIYPVESYPVKLTVKANQDYKGQVYDLVPIDFQITNISGNGTVSRTKNSRLSQEELIAALKDEAAHLGEKNYQIKYKPSDIPTRVDKTPVRVQWNVDWKKGQTYTLTYNIYFPQVSPEYYLLGPFTVGSFKEVRDWQVASDATKCWTGSGADTNWNTTGNWAGGTNPTTTSNATFHGASCTAGTPDKSVTVNVDPTLTGTGGGITLSSDYAGTMTQSSGVTMTITGTIGFVMAGGTFSGGNSLIDTRLFNHTGGSFTSTSGTLQSRNDFTNSGGSFTANGGTIQLDTIADGTLTVTGSQNFANLYFLEDQCSPETITIASGTTLTVANTLTFDNESCAAMTINGPGAISAQGDINLINSGFGDTVTGTAVTTVNGSGTQTITGTGTNPQMPGLVINKTAGTVIFSGSIRFTEDLTYTAGNLSFGTSTVEFDARNDQTLTITGSMNFYNLSFLETPCAPPTYTIASGTTLTSTGTLTFDNQSCAVLTVNGPGGISAKGDISLLNSSYGDGVEGTAITTVNGSGNQTISGSGTNPQMPGITINKSQGTLSLSGSIQFTEDFTYAAGNISPGTSTVTFNARTDTTISIAGSVSLYNVTFQENRCLGTDIITLTSGTILTTTGTLTFDQESCSDLTVNGPGAIYAQGNIVTTKSGTPAGINGSVPITLNGGVDQSITQYDSDFPTGNITVNKSAGTVTPGSNLSFNASGQTLTITSGVVNIGAKNLTVNGLLTINGQLVQTTGNLTASGGITVGSNGIWANNSSGSITLGGNVSNSGYIHLDGGGPTCGDNDAIQIRSSSNGSSRSWTGNGTFYIADVNAQDQGLSGSSKGSNSNQAGGTTLTTTLDTTSGDLLVAMVGWDNGSAATVTMSDSVGTNTWNTVVAKQTDARHNQSMQTFYAKNINGSASTTVTATFSSSSSFRYLIVVDVANIDTTNPLDQTAHTESGSQPTVTVGPVTTTANGEYIFAALEGDNGTGTVTANSPFTAEVSTGSIVSQVQDYVQPSSGSISSSWGLSGGANDALAQMATFKNNGSTPSIRSSGSSITAYSSTSVSGNGWTFNAGCPAYNNRTNVKVTGGAKITGGSKLRSN